MANYHHQLLQDDYGLPFPIIIQNQNISSVVSVRAQLEADDPLVAEMRFTEAVVQLGIAEGRQPWGPDFQPLDDSIILEGEESVGVVLSAEAAVRVLKEEKVKATTECSICLESVGVGEVVARMPCSHDFHRNCISRWLHMKPSCPLCRAPAS